MLIRVVVTKLLATVVLDFSFCFICLLAIGTQVQLTAAMSGYKGKGKVLPYSLYRALGPDMIPVYRRQPADDLKQSTWR